MGNPFAWVEIPVNDMARARRFYEAVFETTLQRMPGTEFEMWSFDFDETSYGAGGALIH
ncbi:MAG: VOC family protein, partial [Candidatus Eremiobacteraeota bacterium]|nr:VOC family protein [Candidatus Eremiobacteraeota bacterium]